MISPFLQDQSLIADIERVAPDSADIQLWWLGQSGFLLHWQGRHLLLDPYLSDSLTEKYTNTDKPHVRLTQRVVAPIALSFIDVVTSSHNHTDHPPSHTHHHHHQHDHIHHHQQPHRRPPRAEKKATQGQP